jgi:hypothetical protein
MMNNKQISGAAALLTALATSNAAGQTSNWTNSSGGTWNLMANWDAAVPLVSTQNAVLGLASVYTVDADIDADIGLLDIANPDATLRIPAGRNFGLNGPTSTNNGLITINHNGSGANGLLSINGAVSLGGSGEIWMRTSSDNSQITGVGLLTNGSSHTIRGVGRIVTPMVNDGTVRADIGVSVSGADLDLLNDITNNGALESALSSQLDIGAITIDQAGSGIIFAQNGGNVNTAPMSLILEGTIDRAGNGELNVLAGAGGTTMTSVTNEGFIDVRPGGALNINGNGFTNNGTVDLNQVGSSANSILTYLTSGNLGGTGEVQMRTSSDNSQLNTDVGMTITHSASHTIRGVGRVAAAMTNNGTISADVGVSFSGNILELEVNDKTNNGDMTAEASSFLQIDGITIDQLGGGDLISNGGDINLNTVTVEGGTYSAPGGGQLRSDSGTQLLSGVTLNGPMRVDPGTTVQVDGDGLVNNDLMQANPDGSSADSILQFTEDAALNGSGELQMRTSGGNTQLNTAAETMVSHASTHLIRGVGDINAAMVNNGEIRADVSVSLSGNDLDLQTNDKVNNNLMVAAAGSFLDIDGIMIDQSGEGPGGMMVADEGEIRLSNATIEGGSYLAIGSGQLRSVAGTQLLSGVTVNGPTVVNPATTIQVDADGMTNNGVMQINPTGSSADAFLQFTDSTTLDGSGEIQMRTLGGNTQINTDPTFTATHAASHLIRGVGQINAAMVNNGTIRADIGVSVSGNILELQTNDKTNTAVISSEAGSVLEVTGITLLQTGAGEIQANDGLVRFNGGATLSGGRIEATGTGEYEVTSSATFNEITSNAPGEVNAGTTLTISGVGLVNNDHSRVNPSQSSADGIIAFPSDGFLNTGTGTGVVELFAAGLNSQIDGPGVVTNGPSHTIAGVGTIDTEFINGGIIAPGRAGFADIGTLNASGDVAFASFGSMTIEVGNANQSDRFAIAGTANLGGTLDVVTIPGFDIGNQIDYTILTAGDVVGTFDTENLIIDGNLITRILYEPTQVRLVTRCIADTNLDGMVTPTDFTAWLNAFNTNDPVADQNLDGNISPTDFTAWIANFNAGCP